MRARRFAVLLALVGLGCRDRGPPASPAELNLVKLTPYLVASEGSDAGIVSVDVAIGGESEPEGIASFTGRISYDTTALAFVEQVSLDDGALRVINATPGLVRIAGVSTAGMPPSRLATLRFHLLRSEGLESATLFFDELHEEGGLDLGKWLEQPDAPVR